MLKVATYTGQTVNFVLFVGESGSVASSSAESAVTSRHMDLWPEDTCNSSAPAIVRHIHLTELPQKKVQLDQALRYVACCTGTINF